MPQLLNTVLLPSLVGCFEEATALVEEHLGIDWPEDDEGFRKARGYFLQMIIEGNVGNTIKTILAHGYTLEPDVRDALFCCCDQIIVSVAVMEHLNIRDDEVLELVLELKLEDPKEDHVDHH